MPFKGFNIKYPEYEVVTPQTHLSFSVRSLSVSEEEKLKGSLMTPSKITEHLNKCIYESCVQKPENITDYKSFLNSITLKDRDSLLYGLYHITYEEIRNYDIRCSNCKKEYPITVKASSMFNYNEYPTENGNILAKKIKVELPVSKGVFAYIKQPTLAEEEIAIKNLASTPGLTIEMITETLIVDKFEQGSEIVLSPAPIKASKKSADKDAITEPILDPSAPVLMEKTITDGVMYENRQDIIDAYRSLPAMDKRTIYEKYNEEFGKFGVELKVKTFCTHCGYEEVVKVDLVENFFRMVYSS